MTERIDLGKLREEYGPSSNPRFGPGSEGVPEVLALIDELEETRQQLDDARTWITGLERQLAEREAALSTAPPDSTSLLRTALEHYADESSWSGCYYLPMRSPRATARAALRGDAGALAKGSNDREPDPGDAEVARLRAFAERFAAIQIDDGPNWCGRWVYITKGTVLSARAALSAVPPATPDLRDAVVKAAIAYVTDDSVTDSSDLDAAVAALDQPSRDGQDAPDQAALLLAVVAAAGPVLAELEEWHRQDYQGFYAPVDARVAFYHNYPRAADLRDALAALEGGERWHSLGSGASGGRW